MANNSLSWILPLFMFLILAFDKIFLPKSAKQSWAAMLVIFGCASLLSVSPEPLVLISRLVGVGRPVDLVVYALCILLVREVFISRFRGENAEQKLTALIRALAIENAKKCDVEKVT